MEYIVIRVYSKATARKRLLQVLSRPFKDLQSAEDWKGFMQTEYPKSKIYVLPVEGELSKIA